MKIRMIGGMVGVTLGLSLVGFAGVADAQSTNASPCAPGGPGRPAYPPNGTSVAVNTSQAPSGGQVDASGCAAPNSRVTFVLGNQFTRDRDLGSAVADPAGSFRARLTIPCDVTNGAYTLRTSGGATASTTLNVSGSTGVCVAGTGRRRDDSPHG